MVSHASSTGTRTYWLQPVSRGMATVYGLMACCYLIETLWPLLTRGTFPKLSNLIFLIFYLLMLGVFTVFSLRSYVRLSNDSIAFARVRDKKVLPFNKIRGRRRYTEKADPYGPAAKHLVLEPNDNHSPKLDLKDGPWFDESFYSWFDSLPDLDAADGIEVPKSKYANFSLV